MSARKENYREHAPCAALRPYVECFWSRRGHAPVSPAPSHRVLPDGCLDIVFNFADGTPWRAAVVGTMTRPLLIVPGRSEDFLGVRFHPGKARAFLRPPADEFTDRAVEFSAVWGQAGADLEERLAAMPTLRARLGALENCLLRRLACAPAADAVLDAVLASVERDRGAVSVRQLSDAAGWSRQHLRRKFAAAVGISPKQFCRVVRFRKLVQSARAHPLGWAEAAAEFGYYDQAHLITDFREFAGLTPTQFFAAR
jgi:AraC-like DNA-binding protein